MSRTILFKDFVTIAHEWNEVSKLEQGKPYVRERQPGDPNAEEWLEETAAASQQLVNTLQHAISVHTFLQSQLQELHTAAAANNFGTIQQFTDLYSKLKVFLSIVEKAELDTAKTFDEKAALRLRIFSRLFSADAAFFAEATNPVEINKRAQRMQEIDQEIQPLLATLQHPAHEQEIAALTAQLESLEDDEALYEILRQIQQQKYLEQEAVNDAVEHHSSQPINRQTHDIEQISAAMHSLERIRDDKISELEKKKKPIRDRIRKLEKEDNDTKAKAEKNREELMAEWFRLQNKELNNLSTTDVGLLKPIVRTSQSQYINDRITDLTKAKIQFEEILADIVAVSQSRKYPTEEIKSKINAVYTFLTGDTRKPPMR